jgi:hypothetical protein
VEHGFLRVRCESCHYEKLVAFSCKRRGFFPSCDARRMVESAALLVSVETNQSKDTSPTVSRCSAAHKKKEFSDYKQCVRIFRQF